VLVTPEQDVHVRGERICHQQLLGEAAGEEEQPGGGQLRRQAGRQPLQLTLHR
jgi:hypothetical protein